MSDEEFKITKHPAFMRPPKTRERAIEELAEAVAIAGFYLEEQVIRDIVEYTLIVQRRVRELIDRTMLYGEDDDV